MPNEINNKASTSGFGILIRNSTPGTDSRASIDNQKYFFCIKVLLNKQKAKFKINKFNNLEPVITTISEIKENGPINNVNKLDHSRPYLRSPPYEASVTTIRKLSKNLLLIFENLPNESSKSQML